MRDILSVDFELNKHIIQQVFGIINKKYFRAQLIDTHKVPPKEANKPRIFFSNHSGMAFPWDSICFHSLFWEHNGFKKELFNYVLGDPALFQYKMLSPYLLDNFWKRAGGVEASMEHFEVLMKANKNVFIYPEGVAGIGKGFQKRYQVQKFSTSFIRMAVEFDAPLIPFYSINAEYNLPYAERNETIDSYSRTIGLPFIPLSPITALALFFPWSYYFALPTKMFFVFGDPIYPQELLKGKDKNSLQRKDYIEMRDIVHHQFQNGLSKNVDKYGQDPFHFTEFVQEMMSDPLMALYTLPFSWPILIKHVVAEYDTGILNPLEYSIWEYIRLYWKNPQGASFAFPLSWPWVLFSHPAFTEELVHNILNLIEHEILKFRDKSKKIFL